MIKKLAAGGPLSHLTVVEMASVLAGPTVGQFFSELGCKVIKVESTEGGGDVTRSWYLSSEKPSPVSSYFSCANWGKESISVDLRKAEGQRIIHDLAKKADIVTASFKPGDAARFNMDYQTLKKVNGKLIYATVTGYGEGDDRAGYDAIAQAECGYTYMNGQTGGEATKMPVAMVDVLASHQIKEAILMQLYLRERSGEGGHVSIALSKAATAGLSNQATAYLNCNVVPQRTGSDHPSIVPYGTLYADKEGKQLLFAVGTDKQFMSLCKVLDLDSVYSQYTSNHSRVINRAVINEKIAQAVKSWKRDELLSILQRLKVPAGPVNNMEEVFNQRDSASLVLSGKVTRGTLAKPVAGVRQVAFTSSSLSQQLDITEPPTYSQHTLSILSSYLGYSDKEIDQLVSLKIVK